jgi:hypothetical protein
MVDSESSGDRASLVRELEFVDMPSLCAAFFPFPLGDGVPVSGEVRLFLAAEDPADPTEAPDSVTENVRK